MDTAGTVERGGTRNESIVIPSVQVERVEPQLVFLPFAKLWARCQQLSASLPRAFLHEVQHDAY